MSPAKFVSLQLSSSRLHPWRASRQSSSRTYHARHGPGPAPHLHEHVPIHVPGRQEISGRMEGQPTGRGFQHDVFRGVPDTGRGFQGVGILLVAPIFHGLLLTRAVHALEDFAPSSSWAVSPETKHTAIAVAQGTYSNSGEGGPEVTPRRSPKPEKAAPAAEDTGGVWSRGPPPRPAAYCVAWSLPARLSYRQSPPWFLHIELGTRLILSPRPDRVRQFGTPSANSKEDFMPSGCERGHQSFSAW